MRLSDLQNKDVLNIEDGKVIGKIIDVIIDDKGIIQKFVVEKYKFLISMFTSHAEIEVSWKNILKIGEDVILVSFN
ncbi:MAG: YlmC/YmxH family sporulation protein [Bacilli bacterium]|nr:YlmC/YmxH family sporulation protein [Bacilli bacterium]